LCTFNLHLLCCQLAQQVKRRGLTWQYGELWVERLIGEFKRRTKYRTHGQPEVTMVNDYLMRCALRQASCGPHGEQLLTWQQYQEAEKLKKAAAKGGVVDSGTAAAGQLLGAGKLLKGRAQAAWTEELQNKIFTAMENAWVGTDKEHLLQLYDDNWEQVQVYKYERAFTPEGMYITSTSYRRSRTRDGTWVWVSYATDGAGEMPYAAQVRYFLCLHLPAEASGGNETDDVRIAVCDFLPYKQPYSDPDVCEVVLVGEEKAARESTFVPAANRDYPVMLEMIEAPLFVHRYKGTNGESLLAFSPLRFKTGGARQAH
jgi:hypothetical protein